MVAIGYARVSTDRQADKGVSLEAQQEKIRAMAVVHGADLAEVIVDAESGKTLDRPGMQRLLALVEARALDLVIVAKLDRLTRSVRDLADLLDRFQRRGVGLVSVAESLDTQSAAGRLVLNIMASVSQWEREAIGERTRDALAHKKANGQRAGNIPYGYRLAPDGVHVEASPEEQAALVRIVELRTRGYTLQEIALKLNGQGIRTRAGSEWKNQYVAKILKKRAGSDISPPGRMKARALRSGKG